MRALTLNEQKFSRSFSFNIEGCKPVNGIPVDCSGNRAYRLQPMSPQHPAMWVVVEVSLRRAVKVVTIRSGFKVRQTHLSLFSSPKHLLRQTHS